MRPRLLAPDLPLLQQKSQAAAGRSLAREYEGILADLQSDQDSRSLSYRQRVQSMKEIYDSKFADFHATHDKQTTDLRAMSESLTQFQVGDLAKMGRDLSELQDRITREMPGHFQGQCVEAGHAIADHNRNFEALRDKIKRKRSHLSAKLSAFPTNLDPLPDLSGIVRRVRSRISDLQDQLSELRSRPEDSAQQTGIVVPSPTAGLSDSLEQIQSTLIPTLLAQNSREKTSSLRVARSDLPTQFAATQAELGLVKQKCQSTLSSLLKCQSKLDSFAALVPVWDQAYEETEPQIDARLSKAESDLQTLEALFDEFESKRQALSESLAEQSAANPPPSPRQVGTTLMRGVERVNSEQLQFFSNAATLQQIESVQITDLNASIREALPVRLSAAEARLAWCTTRIGEMERAAEEAKEWEVDEEQMIPRLADLEKQMFALEKELDPAAEAPPLLVAAPFQVVPEPEVDIPPGNAALLEIPDDLPLTYSIGELAGDVCPDVAHSDDDS
jgi:chromosome segregation ATPase